MNRILAFRRSSHPILAVAALALALLAAAACADISPAIGKYYVGRTLHVSVAAMERADELLYSIPAAAGAAPQYYRLTPTEPEQGISVAADPGAEPPGHQRHRQH